MSKAQNSITNRRRFLRLAGTTAAATALLATSAVTATAASITDPVLVIAAERDRLKAIHAALEAKCHAISDANPAQMWGQGWPRVDRSLDVFKGTPWEDGYHLMREEIEERFSFSIFPRKREALLAWWDNAYAEMERLGDVTGYKQANMESDAACGVLIDKECELADVQATTIAGAFARLETGVNTVCDDDDPGAYERMITGALADLKRLLAGLA